MHGIQPCRNCQHDVIPKADGTCPGCGRRLVSDERPESTHKAVSTPAEVFESHEPAVGAPKSLGYLFDPPPSKPEPADSEYLESGESASSIRIIFQSLAAVHFVTAVVNLRLSLIAAAAEFALAYFTWSCSAKAEALEHECERLGPRTRSLLSSIRQFLIFSLISAIVGMVMAITSLVYLGEAIKERQRQDWRNGPQFQRDTNNPGR